MANLIKMGQGTYSNYAALSSKDQYQVYFTTDTHQIFVGADEYTKSTKIASAAPVDGTTQGEVGALYAYNGALYLCSGSGTTWTRVANINDTAGTVTSIEAGEGLETASGEAITATGTIKHAVPTGATTVVNPLAANQNAEFGGTVTIQGVATDKFGHVTAATTSTITMPNETPVTIASPTTAASTLTPGASFEVVTGLAMASGSGATDHDLVPTTTTFTLPSDVNTTYTISSDTEGVVTLTGSDASSSTALINGWNDLAKKSDITAVFKYKGSVSTVQDLPQEAAVGDVYQVGTSEYVCITAGTGASQPAVYEELGPVVDLSAYATTAYVDEKLTWQTF